MPQKVYDAIVIGSGCVGGWAAKELCEGGMQTAVLEVGRTLDPEKDFTEHHWPYDMPFRGFGQPGVIAKEQWSTAGFASEYNAHLFVKDAEVPYTFPRDKPFQWVRSRQVGGRSITWGRQSYRYSNYDFNAASHDGYGDDWPIRYEDLAPYYDKVEDFVGISGRAEGWEALPDGHFLPPMNFTCAEAVLKKAVDGFGDRVMTIGRTAILTRDHNGRLACHYCGHCSRGCSTGSYYSSPASTLPAARKTRRMTLVPNAVAREILVDGNGKPNGVSYVHRVTKQEHRVYGKVIVVCASALESTRLLLLSKSRFHPAGLGNSSGVLGRYLMDHTIGVGAGGWLPALAGRPTEWDDGRVNGLYIPRYRNLKTRHPNYIRGWGHQGGGARGMFPNHARNGVDFGSALKQRVRNHWVYPIGLGCWGEMLARWDNYVEIDPNVKDAWGIPALHIVCSHGDNELKMAEDMVESSLEMLHKAGAEITYVNRKPRLPGACIHEMGTCRMGADPKKSVLNKWNQSWDCKNLFVTDASCFTSSACANPTLTAMAITARAAGYIVDQFRQGNL